VIYVFNYASKCAVSGHCVERVVNYVLKWQCVATVIRGHRSRRDTSPWCRMMLLILLMLYRLWWRDIGCVKTPSWIQRYLMITGHTVWVWMCCGVVLWALELCADLFITCITLVFTCDTRWLHHWINTVLSPNPLRVQRSAKVWKMLHAKLIFSLLVAWPI
jgi:hypothetical protein